MIDDEILAVRATKAKAIKAFGEYRILAVSNWGAGVWLTDNTYIPVDQIATDVRR